MGAGEFQVRAGGRCGVAVSAAAVVGIGQCSRQSGGTAAVGLAFEAAGEAGVVETVVAQQRALMATQAVAAANEQAQPGAFGGAQHGRAGIAVLELPQIAIKACGLGAQLTLEGFQGFADIGGDAVERVGCGLAGQGAEQGFVVAAVVVGDRLVQSIAAEPVFAGIGQLLQGLRPQAVGAAVPEVPAAPGDAGEAGRVALRRADGSGFAQAIGEVARGLVAGRAGDLAVGTQTRIGEQLGAEGLRARIVGDAVAGAVRWWGEGLERQCAQRRQLACGPFGRRGGSGIRSRFAAAEQECQCQQRDEPLGAGAPPDAAARSSTRDQVQRHAVVALVLRDVEADFPPAGHAELQAFDQVLAGLGAGRDFGLRG